MCVFDKVSHTINAPCGACYELEQYVTPAGGIRENMLPWCHIMLPKGCRPEGSIMQPEGNIMCAVYLPVPKGRGGILILLLGRANIRSQAYCLGPKFPIYGPSK